MITCDTIMSKDLTVAFPHITVDKLALVMRDSKIGAIPIVDSDGSNKLIGIVTDRDIVVRVMAEGKDASTIPAADIMSKNVVVCGVETTLDDALYIMLTNEVRRLPIINRENAVVGILSTADIANVIRPSFQAPELTSALARSDIDVDFEAMRVRFEAEMDNKIAELKSKYDGLMLRMRVEAMDAKEKVSQSPAYKDLIDLKSEFEANLEKLKETSEEGWADMKLVISDTWSNLEAKYQEVKEICGKSLTGSAK
ncbi:MAG: CBS domain-containing protein [Candidatus Obscuribacterales bacterium]|nr:CBS domain-containing protein [Candidatus Obscuribacterales bacterium]